LRCGRIQGEKDLKRDKVNKHQMYELHCQ